MLDSNEVQCNICFDESKDIKYCKNDKCKIGICSNCINKINEEVCPFCRTDDCFIIELNDVNVKIFQKMRLSIFNFKWIILDFIFINKFNLFIDQFLITNLYCFNRFRNCFYVIFMIFNIIYIIFCNTFYFYFNLNRKKFLFFLFFIIKINFLFFSSLGSCEIELIYFLFLSLVVGIFNYLLYLSIL